MRKLAIALICAAAMQAAAQTPTAIHVDLAKAVGPYKPIYSLVRL